MKGWTVAAVLAGVLALGSAEHARTVEQTARYAKVIAHCTNGGSFAVQERLVMCEPVDIVLF